MRSEKGREAIVVPRVKCDWDCCLHYNTETGYCDNPDEIELSTIEIDVVNDEGKETSETLELFECSGFIDYEEEEAK